MPTPSSPPTSKRIEWLDVAKGIGILIVAAGHILGNSGNIYIDTAREWIMQAARDHMYLFFLMSGYLFKPQHIRTYTWHKFHTLLVPYFSYLTLGFILVQTTNILFGNFSILGMLKLAIMDFYGGYFLKGEMTAFWFLSCLFLTQIMFCYTFNKSSHHNLLAYWIAIAAAATTCIATVIPNLHLPWALNNVPIAMSFFGLGYLLKESFISKKNCLGSNTFHFLNLWNSSF